MACILQAFGFQLLSRFIGNSRAVAIASFTLLFMSSSAPMVANEPMRIMTYNIRYANSGDGDDIWANRAETVSKTIQQADIIGLQEVVLKQLQDLQKNAPGYTWFGVGREDGKEKGEFCPIAFDTDRFKMMRRGTFWLSTEPDQVGKAGWDAALPRIATWVVLQDHNDDREFFVLNTHFDHRGAEARKQSAALIVSKCLELAEDLPWIVMGDLNAKPDSEPINAILSAKKSTEPLLKDARELSEQKPSGPTGTWNGFKEIDLQTRIDHVFVNSQVRVNELAVLDPRTPSGRFASDHLPIAAVIQFKESN